MPAIVYILASVLLNVFGQFSLKIGTRHLGGISFSGGFPEFIRVFTNPNILAGLFFYGISSIFWIIALSKTDLSYAYPFLSLGYVLIVIFSYFILGENLSIYRLAGIALVIAGLILISYK